MLVGFKKKLNRLKIYKRNLLKNVCGFKKKLKSLKIYKRSPFKNIGRFQKFEGNTNVNRLIFMDGRMVGRMVGRSFGRSGNFFLSTLRNGGL